MLLQTISIMIYGIGKLPLGLQDLEILFIVIGIMKAESLVILVTNYNSLKNQNLIMKLIAEITLWQQIGIRQTTPKEIGESWIAELNDLLKQVI